MAAQRKRTIRLYRIAEDGRRGRRSVQDTVEYLPKGRARNCKREYEQVTFAFNTSIRPHIDERLEKQVLDRTWLPDVKEPPVPEDNLQAGSRALQ